MGKYFTNETLDGLWTRLVNATNALTYDELKPKYVTDKSSGSQYLYLDGTTLRSSGPNSGFWEIDLGGGETYHLPQDLDEISSYRYPISCDYYASDSDYLDRDDTYRVMIDFNLNQESYHDIRHIHDALLIRFGLEHNKAPETPGDYMKGIAVAARYAANGYTDDTSKNTLEQIVGMLEESSKPVEEYSLLLNNDLVMTIEPEHPYLDYYSGDIYCTLYNEAGAVVCEPTGAEGCIPFDFVSCAEDYGINIPAGRYYATCSFTWYHPETGSGSFAETSEPVYYEGGSAPVEPFDLSLTIEQNENTYTARAWILDPSYSPVPDTIEISIYTEINAVDTLVGSKIYYNKSDITIDVRDIASSLNQYQEYRVYAVARKTGYENTSASGSFTWHFESTGGDVPPQFAVSIRVDGTDVIVTPTDYVTYYQFILYTKASEKYVSDATCFVYTGEEYRTSLSNLLGSSLVEGVSYKLSVTAQSRDATYASASTTFTWRSSTPPSFLGSISAYQESTEIVILAENFTIGNIEISLPATWDDTYYHYNTVNGITYTFDPVVYWKDYLQNMYEVNGRTEHTLTIKAYDQSDNSNYATTTVTYTYDPDEEPGEEKYPDITAKPYADWDDNNIYISGYSDEKYNGIEVRITTRHWDTQPEPDYYTTFGYLDNGYVMNGDGSKFEGYPYASIYEYTILLYQYIEEEGRDEYSPEFTMPH